MSKLVNRYDLRALARSFPTLEKTPDEFFESAGAPVMNGIGDAITFAKGDEYLDSGSHFFARWARAGGGGQCDAALFVLSVWNWMDDWSGDGLTRGDSGRFDVHRALGNWDPGHRAAFVAWAREPWWL